MPLRERLEALLAREAGPHTAADRELFEEFRRALGRGEIRAAEPERGTWRVNAWVKRGILLGFRMGVLADMSGGGALRFFDKDTYPLKPLALADGVRVVPGGSSIRDGAYLAPGVVCMPPMYVNVGAYVDEGTGWSPLSRGKSMGSVPPPRRGGQNRVCSAGSHLTRGVAGS